MAKVLSKEEWKRRKRLYAYAKLAVAAVLALLIVVVLVVGVVKVAKNLFSRGDSTSSEEQTSTMKQDLNITELFLSKNQYSRPGNALVQVKGIVIHYVANAGSSAVDNRNYYESLKDGTQNAAESSHFIIGLEGELVQCIPLSEVACASGARNADTISITFCHPLIDGVPTDEAHRTLVNLVAYLCNQYGLDKTAVLRHSDLRSQVCPKYFAEQEGKWAAFLAEVDTMLAGMKKK